MALKVHRIKYNHGDGRAGTMCGIELRAFDGVYNRKTVNPLRRVPEQFDLSVKIGEREEITCAKCLTSGPDRPSSKLRKYR